MDSYLASKGPKWTLSYVLNVQFVPRLAELALNTRTEDSLQLLYGYGELLPASLAVELPSVPVILLHAPQI